MEEGVLEEAEFYNIQTLIEVVKERIRERDRRKLDDVSFDFFEVQIFSCRHDITGAYPIGWGGKKHRFIDDVNILIKTGRDFFNGWGSFIHLIKKVVE